jgi:hypothetical protein
MTIEIEKYALYTVLKSVRLFRLYDIRVYENKIDGNLGRRSALTPCPSPASGRGETRKADDL